jgi:hypothetical protein
MTALFPASGAPTAATPRQAGDGSPIYTVSQLTRQIRDTLERHVGLVWLTGEIGNLRVPASGHCYFTLKDESAQIAAVMWRTLAETLKFRMTEGLSVLAQGEVTVYEPDGTPYKGDSAKSPEAFIHILDSDTIKNDLPPLIEALANIFQ